MFIQDCIFTFLCLSADKASGGAKICTSMNLVEQLKFALREVGGRSREQARGRGGKHSLPKGSTYSYFQLSKKFNVYIDIWET